MTDGGVGEEWDDGSNERQGGRWLIVKVFVHVTALCVLEDLQPCMSNSQEVFIPPFMSSSNREAVAAVKGALSCFDSVLLIPNYPASHVTRKDDFSLYTAYVWRPMHTEYQQVHASKLPVSQHDWWEISHGVYVGVML